MADEKLTELGEETNPVGTDLVYVVLDPAGTPDSAKVQIANLPVAPEAHLTDAGAHPLQANNQTGTTYTLVLTDGGKVIESNNGSAIALTVPTNASVAFPVGTIIEIYQQGAGQVTVAGAGGVTVNAANGLKTAAQHSLIALWKRATDTWVLSGDAST